jgi:hypothetical protein
MNDHLLTIVGTAITVLSFIYAVYANRKAAKIIDYNREQSWELYRLSSNVLARYQQLEAIKFTDTAQVENIAKGEVTAQELVLNAIRMIKRFEKNFTRKQIDIWLKEGRLVNETHLKPFMNLAQK